MEFHNQNLSDNYQVEEIVWRDAQSGFSSPWTVEELKNEPLLLTHSIGYVLHEDDNKVILGFMLFGEPDMVKHWQSIPKGMIVERIKYNKKIP